MSKYRYVQDTPIIYFNQIYLYLQEIRQTLGDFDFGAAPSQHDQYNLEVRPMQILENQAKFEGEW